MSWFDRLKSGVLGSVAGAGASDSASTARLSEWQTALDGGVLPSFVRARLADAAARKTPWISTTTPTEMGLIRKYGIRPVATISGTCWYHHGYSWTRGHHDGWNMALDRMRAEARLLQANAIIDVKMRTSRLEIEDSMDFTVLGTAVYIDGLPKSDDPVIATVPALEFARLLKAGIIPTGIAIGAHYEWLSNYYGDYYNGDLSGSFSFVNQPLRELTDFWETVRRRALRELCRDAGRLGDGVLAHTHFGQLLKVTEDKNVPPQYLGRHIVVGTVVHAKKSVLNESPDIALVIDMRDEASALLTPSSHGHTAYKLSQEDGAI